MTVISKETSNIRQIAGDFIRHPHQVNGLLEADAEIIKLPGQEGYIVLKTDGIHEEIRERLYEDPYLIGWMTITAPVSDIAAVGAIPTGILLSLILPKSQKDEWLEQFKLGINNACYQYNIYVLGGDTNFDKYFSVSATVLAGINSGRPLLRKGMKPGDYLYTTAHLGSGNAYAYCRYFDKELKIDYQPIARLAESRVIRKFASACTDTSDGLFPALAVLSEINGIGFNIDRPLKETLSADALTVHLNAKLPEWILLAGPHGEYELLFTIGEEIHNEFIQACKQEALHPVYIGRVINEEQVIFHSDTMQVQCHPATIANLFSESGENVSTYYELLMKQHQSWNKK